MVARISTLDRRRALRLFKQRGIVVHVGALEQLYDAYDSLGEGEFGEFLDKALGILARPDGAPDGILTKELSISISDRLKRDADRRDGVTKARLEVIDSFTVPRWRPQAVATSNVGSAGRKIKAPVAPLIDGPASAKGEMFRHRFELVLSKTLRNPKFRPSTSSLISVGKKSPYFQLTGIESLAGTNEEKLVLGMLTQLEEGTWFLEDLNGTIKLDLSQASITQGLHTECSFVIVQGFHIEEDGEDPVFRVSAMGTPPPESREDSIVTLGRDSNLFGGQYDPNEMTDLLKMEEEAVDSVFLLLSDVALDNSKVMAGLRHIFQGYLEDDVVPSVVVLMGNFLSHPFGQNVDDVGVLQDRFAELGDMIATNFKAIAEQTMFVIIPGGTDPGPGNVLPRPPMPKMITRKFVEALGNDRVHLASNPCRIRYMTQEIVLMRDDIMQKMVRHCSVKPELDESGLMSEHLIKSVVDQAYLCPLPLAARPVLWSHDHSMWLFPTPNIIVLADKVDSYICKYAGSLGLNPGSFTTDFSFQMYLAAEKRVQQCSLDSEELGVMPDEHSRQHSDMENGESDAEPGSVGSISDVQDSETENLSEMAARNKGHDDREMNVIDDKAATATPLNSRDGASQEKNSPLVQDEEESDQRGVPQLGEAAEQVGGEVPAEYEVASESDDDSFLVPAEGIKRIDIRALVRNSLVDDSLPIPQGNRSISSEEESNDS